MITLRGRLEPEDYIQAQYLHLRPPLWVKYLGFAALGFCLFVLLASITSLNTFINTLINLAPIFLLCLVYVFILFVTLPRKTRQVFSQQKALQVEYEAVISPEVIETTSEHGSMRMNLSDFHTYKVGKDLVLLYQSQVMFHIFPRRFFTSKEDFTTFLTYLEANLGRPKR